MNSSDAPNPNQNSPENHGEFFKAYTKAFYDLSKATNNSQCLTFLVLVGTIIWIGFPWIAQNTKTDSTNQKVFGGGNLSHIFKSGSNPTAGKNDAPRQISELWILQFSPGGSTLFRALLALGIGLHLLRPNRLNQRKSIADKLLVIGVGACTFCGMLVLIELNEPLFATALADPYVDVFERSNKNSEVLWNLIGLPADKWSSATILLLLILIPTWVIGRRWSGVLNRLSIDGSPFSLPQVNYAREHYLRYISLLTLLIWGSAFCVEIARYGDNPDKYGLQSGSNIALLIMEPILLAMLGLLVRFPTVANPSHFQPCTDTLEPAKAASYLIGAKPLSIIAIVLAAYHIQNTQLAIEEMKPVLKIRKSFAKKMADASEEFMRHYSTNTFANNPRLNLMLVTNEQIVEISGLISKPGESTNFTNLFFKVAKSNAPALFELACIKDGLQFRLETTNSSSKYRTPSTLIKWEGALKDFESRLDQHSTTSTNWINTWWIIGRSSGNRVDWRIKGTTEPGYDKNIQSIQDIYREYFRKSPEPTEGDHAIDYLQKIEYDTFQRKHEKILDYEFPLNRFLFPWILLAAILILLVQLRLQLRSADESRVAFGDVHEPWLILESATPTEHIVGTFWACTIVLSPIIGAACLCGTWATELSCKGGIVLQLLPVLGAITCSLLLILAAITGVRTACNIWMHLVSIRDSFKQSSASSGPKDVPPSTPSSPRDPSPIPTNPRPEQSTPHVLAE